MEVGLNAVNLTDLVLKLSLFRHSGESRNPGFSGFLDPGFRRGDAVDKGNILKLTAWVRPWIANLGRLYLRGWKMGLDIRSK